MLECLILGDSIAVGVAKLMPECQVQATVGIGSAAFLQVMEAKDSAATVISLGSNDGTDPTPELLSIRAKIHSRRVIWIVPGRPHVAARRAVGMIADAYGDRVLLIPDYAPDRTHPSAKGYASLAKSIKHEAER